jgi:hypothetical protein
MTDAQYCPDGPCSGYVRKPVTVYNAPKNNVLQVLILGVLTIVLTAKHIGVRKRFCRSAIQYS